MILKNILKTCQISVLQLYLLLKIFFVKYETLISQDEMCKKK